MKIVLIKRFLGHLMSCTDAVLAQEEIDSDDIFRIRRELVEFKRHIDGKETIDPVVLDEILCLDLRVDEALLGDSRRSVWRLIAGAMFRRSFYSAIEGNRIEKLKQQITDFRNNLDHIRFSIDWQKAPNSERSTAP